MNWDYLAGFFDGEGALVNYRNGFRISITQANKKILEKICDFTKVGHICEITKRKEHWKDSWVYFIAKQSDVHTFLKKIEPKLILKKELAGEAIIKLENNLRVVEEKKLKVIKRIKDAKKLRKGGLSYRAIGKKLSIDWGYARRLIKFR